MIGMKAMKGALSRPLQGWVICREPILTPPRSQGVRSAEDPGEKALNGRNEPAEGPDAIDFMASLRSSEAQIATDS